MRAPRPVSLAVFTVALSVRLLHLQQVAANDPFYARPTVDSLSYVTWAKQLAAGDWLGTEPFFLSPLYGYLLGVLYLALGPGMLAPLILNALLGALTCALVYNLARRLFDGRAALAAAALFAFYRIEIFYEGAPLLEALQAALTTAAVWAALAARDPPRRSRCLGAGVLLGLSVLARENSLLLAAPLAAWLGCAPGLDVPRRLALAAIYLAGVGLMVSLATVRNAAVARDFVLVNSTGGILLYTGWNPDANGVYVVPSVFSRAGGADDPVEQKEAYRALAEQRVGHSLRPSEVSSYWRREALQFVRDNPRRSLALGCEKARLFWNAFEAWDVRSVTLAESTSWVLRLPLVTFGVLAPLGLLGMALSARRWRELLPLYFTIAAHFASAVIFIALSRYRLPTVPILAVFAGAGVIRLLDAGHARQLRAAALAVTLLALAATGVNSAVPREDLSVAHFDLGNAYDEGGRLPEAAAEYLAAVEAAPRYIPAWNNLALLYERMDGQRGSAVRSWQRVRELAAARGSRVHVERSERHLRALHDEP